MIEPRNDLLRCMGADVVEHQNGVSLSVLSLFISQIGIPSTHLQQLPFKDRWLE